MSYPEPSANDKSTLDQDSSDRKPLSAILLQNMTPQLLNSDLTNLDMRSQNFCKTV